MDQALSYSVRVNRGIDFILQHLAEPILLEEVARRAGFSPFHFHRVFKALVGETLGGFVTRMRLERALSLQGRLPSLTLTEVALRCGFGSSSNFSRTFKKHYGVSPSAFDLAVWRQKKRAQLGEHLEGDPALHHIEERTYSERSDAFPVRVRTYGPRKLAYLRVYNSYRPGGVTEAASRLLAWSELYGLSDSKWYGYMWDDPEVVDLKDCRYDVAVEIPPNHQLFSSRSLAPHNRDCGDAVGLLDLPEMTLAEVEVVGPIELEMQALDWLFQIWLPKSGHVPAPQPVFEAWHGRPFAHGTEHFELSIQLPVEP